MQTKFDLGKNIPETIVVTNGKVNDKNKLDDNIKIIYDKVIYLGKESTYKTTEKFRIIKNSLTNKVSINEFYCIVIKIL
jgi:hypothetical protein